MKSLPKMYLWTRNNSLNVGSRPFLDYEDAKNDTLRQ